MILVCETKSIGNRSRNKKVGRLQRTKLPPPKTLKTHLHRSKADGYQIPSWGGGRNWELGINIYIDTTIYNIDSQQGRTTKPQATLLEIL